jgi:hypothetical protein
MAEDGNRVSHSTKTVRRRSSSQCTGERNLIGFPFNEAYRAEKRTAFVLPNTRACVPRQHDADEFIGNVSR